MAQSVRGALPNRSRLRLTMMRRRPPSDVLSNPALLGCALRSQTLLPLVPLPLVPLRLDRLRRAQARSTVHRNALHKRARLAPPHGVTNPPSRRNTRPARCACPSA